MSKYAQQLTIESLDCGNCLLARQGGLCQPVTEAVLRAARVEDPTVDIGSEDRQATAAVMLKIPSSGATEAGRIACADYMRLYNETTAEKPLNIMV